MRKRAIVENVGEVAFELEWVNAPAKAIDIVGKKQLLTLDSWSDYETKKEASEYCHVDELVRKRVHIL